VQPIVGVDGWANIINNQKQFDGMSFEYDEDGPKLKAITCLMYRKDRSHPTSITEYMVECDRGTEPWKKWPRRMLRQKAMIQCARMAFSLSGIVDEDEAERMAEVGAIVVDPTMGPVPDEDRQEIMDLLKEKGGEPETAHPEEGQPIDDADFEVIPDDDTQPPFSDPENQRLWDEGQEQAELDEQQAADDAELLAVQARIAARRKKQEAEKEEAEKEPLREEAPPVWGRLSAMYDVNPDKVDEVMGEVGLPSLTTFDWKTVTEDQIELLKRASGKIAARMGS